MKLLRIVLVLALVFTPVAFGACRSTAGGGCGAGCKDCQGCAPDRNCRRGTGCTCPR
jgi:hypothetical protein